MSSIVIESVEPQLHAGRHPVKRICGDRLEVKADIFKEGHDVLVGVVRWRQLTPSSQAERTWHEAPLRPIGNDRWEGSFPLPNMGRYAYTLEAWADPFRTWVSELERRLQVGQDVRSELVEGAALLRAAASRAGPSSPDGKRLQAAAAVLADEPAAKAAPVALEPELREIAARHVDRSLAKRFDRELEVIVDRPLARTGAWYELFPRSTSGDARRHGTFRDCESHLPHIQAMGFDVLYFPPIHPIGKTGRKGRNNSPKADANDPGSPWAIGSSDGGYKSVHPSLGTLQDFRDLVRHASKYGIEIALDLAFQCSPDHPYVREHPEWFSWRPDATLKTAENPPKRYEDIVNFDFLGPARESLWAELKSVVFFWIGAGVKVFRVDNPHTKPLPFWEWLIREVQNEHPEVIFLAEAFTRPKMMKELAKVGFSQSYTYFTWRNFKHELEEYLRELTSSPTAEYMRGNLWPNTPDILPEFLQQGKTAAFKIRLALAATLSSSYGIYSGYELCEAQGVPGTEEYQDSEKYQLVARNSKAPGNIVAFVSAINRIRKENPALQLYTNLMFYPAENDRIIFYRKSKPDRSNQLLIAVSLDPHSPQEAVLEIPLAQLGIAESETYQVHELLTDQRSLWQSGRVSIRLTPEQPAAIWSVLRFVRRENSFDYYY